MKRLLKWIISIFKRNRFNPCQYSIDKNKQVKHRGRKLKVRQFIAKMAHQMHELNEEGYNPNRLMLIDAYNKGGFDKVKKHCLSQVDIYIGSNSK